MRLVSHFDSTVVAHQAHIERCKRHAQAQNATKALVDKQIVDIRQNIEVLQQEIRKAQQAAARTARSLMRPDADETDQSADTAETGSSRVLRASDLEHVLYLLRVELRALLDFVSSPEFTELQARLQDIQTRTVHRRTHFLDMAAMRTAVAASGSAQGEGGSSNAPARVIAQGLGLAVDRVGHALMQLQSYSRVDDMPNRLSGLLNAVRAAVGEDAARTDALQGLQATVDEVEGLVRAYVGRAPRHEGSATDAATTAGFMPSLQQGAGTSSGRIGQTRGGASAGWIAPTPAHHYRPRSRLGGGTTDPSSTDGRARKFHAWLRGANAPVDVPRPPSRADRAVSPVSPGGTEGARLETGRPGGGVQASAAKVRPHCMVCVCNPSLTRLT